MTLSGDKGARDLAAEATIVPAKKSCLFDVDTPADLERATEILAARNVGG